jgi:hypothetical protein
MMNILLLDSPASALYRAAIILVSVRWRVATIGEEVVMAMDLSGAIWTMSHS